MKKVLLLLIIFSLSCTFGWAQLGVGQQFLNNNFEIWENESNTNYSAPKYWHTINDATGGYAGSASDGQFVTIATGSPGGGNCVKLTSVWKLVTVANGSLTSGRFNAGSMTPSNSKNCTYTSTNSGYNRPMTAYPDSVYMYVRTNSTREARVNIVIHNNVKSNGASQNAIYQDPTPSSSSNSVVNTNSSDNEAKAVAKATLNFQTNGSWAYKKIPFTYTGNNTTPSYILATFSTNKTAGGGNTGDNLWIDDVVLIYNTRLDALTVGGTPIDGFNPDVTTYTYPTAIATCAGASFPAVSGTPHSSHAYIDAQYVHTPSENEPYAIIRVQHLNQANSQGVYRDYRVNFNVIKAPAAPTVSAPNADCATSAHPVQLTATSEGASTYHWYTSATGSEYNTGSTGSNFTTPAISGSVTYYVSALNAYNCESSRTPVTATVNINPAAPTAANTTSVCAGENATFTATLPAGDNLICRWYATNNSSEVLGTGTSLEVSNLTLNTTRYAETYNSVTGCYSGRTAVTVNVKSTPAAPSLNGDSRCGSGDLTLSVVNPNNDYTYTWYNATNAQVGTGNSYTATGLESTAVYHVTATANGCTGASTTVTATINPLPNVSINAVNPICAGQSATLTASGANTYSWDNNLGEGNNKQVSPGSTTSYTVTGTGANGCSNTANVTVTVNQLPNVSINEVNAICAGQSATLTASGADSYSWDNNLGEGNNKQVTPGTPTSYTVTGTNNATGCTNTASITVTVNPLPNVSINAVNPLCAGESATLTASGATSYSWDNGLGTGNDKVISPATTTTYTVTGTDANECSNTASVTVTVDTIPAAPTSQDAILCGSGSAVLTAVPAEGCTCQWFDANDEPIETGVSSDSKTLTTSNLQNNTVFYVRSVNPSTSCHSSNTTINVTVAAMPGRPTASGKSRCGAGSVELTATPGNNADNCHWYSTNNELLYEGTTYQTANLEGNTNFICKSYNSETGCESSSTQQVAVTINPIPGTPTVSGNSPICGSGAIQLTGTPGTNANTCRWINGEETTIDNTFGTGIINQSTDYLVQSYNSSTQCYSENVTVSVVVNSLPAAPQTTNDTQCSGEEVTLTASSAEHTIVRWYASAQDNNILYEGSEFHPANLTIGETNFYAAAYNTQTQCTSAERAIATATMIATPAIPNVADINHCGPSTFTLNVIDAQDGITYKWYENAQGGAAFHTGSSYTTGELNSITHYYVSATTNGSDCESDRKDVTITINPIPANLTISGNEAICAGQNLTVSATADNATDFIWSDGQNISEGPSFTTSPLTENTNYTVKAYNANTQCESAVMEFTVTVHPNPAVPEANSVAQCQNESLTLTASATSGNTCYWYTSEISENAISTGNNYSPTNLTVGNTTFYVSQRNNQTHCESPRTAVVATVYPTYAVNYPVTACDSFRWNNELFTESGNHERTLHTQHNCDSVVTLQLTINHSKVTHIDTTVCDVFVWNGQNYETSGDYQQSFSTVQNCDSTVYVHLTVKKSTTGSDHIYLCSNQLPYNYNNLQTIPVTNAGTYNYTVHTTNAAGCDSTINLTVTVNTQPSPAISLTPAARCGEGDVTLTAHAGQNGTSCSWYASENDNEVLFIGTSYPLNNLTATTTYYVSSYNDYNGHPCESSRQAITATINNNPAEPTVADQVRCGDGSVEFTATIDTNATTCRWYVTAGTSTISATALSYTTNVNVSNGSKSYFVESYNENTGCKSSRKEVHAQAFAIPTAPVLTDMSNCGPQAFSIDAPTSGYYNWYDNEESTDALDINNNTTPLISESRSYFISHAVDYTGISCESGRTELALTIYPVYEAQNIYDTLCQGETYTQHGLNETFNTAGAVDRTLNTVSSHNCDSIVTLHLWVKEIRSYGFDTTVCDNFTWNNENFTTSEIITRHFNSSIGCDSVVTVRLTVNNSTETEFSVTACDSYQWNDETYTTSGDHVQHFNTVNGCDSTVTLHLTIHQSAQHEFSDIACNEYHWNDSTYTISGDYVQLFQTSNNCDSTVTLHLTVNYSNAATLNDEVCAETRYTDNGFDTLFTTAGSYTLVRHDLNQAGCDSTTTLTLKVNPIYNQNVTLTICETALPYTWNDTTYQEGTASGDYEHTYRTSTASGCDSIINLHLTISHQYITPLTADICEGSTYTFGDRILDQSGIYYDTLQASNLCDSIVMLTLTVHELHTTNLSASICLGETYAANGFNVTPETDSIYTYQQIVHTTFGCDSTINLTLTVHPTYFFESEEEICDYNEYIWEGHNVEIGTLTAGTHIFWDSLKTVNHCDSIFKLTLTVHPSFFQAETANTCANAEYVWEGHNVEIGTLTAGTHIFWDSLKTVNNCDSVYMLTLTVSPTFYEEEEDTTCSNEAYVWEGHNVEIGTLTAGTHVFWDSLKTVNLCDSVYKLTLTVNAAFYDEAEATTCDNETYVWQGHEHINIGQHETGVYTIWDSLKTVNNCDSIYKLTLTVTPTFYEEENATTCDNEAYVWEGHTVEIGLLEADTYTIWDSLKTVNGCDSVYKLTLTVNQTKHTDLYAEICAGDVYEYNDNYYETQNDYNFTFPSALGCDSTVTLHLTVNPVYDIDTTINICEGLLPYTFADTVFNGSSHKDILLHTQHGCDSIYHVNLNVTPFITSSLNITICDNELPYDFQDSTFNQAGVYEVTVSHDDGCNEIITLTLNVNPTYDTTVYATACGSYTVDRGTYQRVLTESGIYVDTLSSISGCDSIIRLNLTINPLKEILLTDTICQGEIYTDNGFNLNPENAGIVYDTLHLECVGTGCDSTVYLELTVNPSYNHTFDTTVCGQFVWNDSSYTESGVISHSFTLATGCDSTVTYNLTVNPVYNITIDTTVCDQFVWNGQNYSESGILTYTYSLPSTCDSTVTVNLTVNHSQETLLTPVICQGESYTENGFNLNPENAGIVYDTLHLQCVGTDCDSTVYLELTVNPSYNQTLDTTVCGQFVWNDSTYTVSDIISYNFTLATGCDSTVTYNLTVNPVYNITIDTTVCDQFVWNGETYTESTTLTHSYTLPTTCDSTVNINLTVNHSVTENPTLTICQSELPYTWRDITFDAETTVGTHQITYELETVEHCDSIVNLTLIVNPNNEYYDAPVSFCEGGSYEWNNQIITESGLYTDTVDNDYGCYDVYKLEVTVNPVYSYTEYDTVCANELPVVWQGRTINQAGTTTANYYTTAGCDSTYQLVLTVNPSYFIPETVTICDNEEYVWEGHNVAIGQHSAGTYTFYDSLTTVAGCDSVYQLTLTVTPTYHFDVETATVCDNEEYIWEGHNVQIGQQVEGTYTFYDSLSTMTYGCDSIYTLVLTVTPSYHFDIETDTICDNEEYIWAGHEHITIGQLTAGTHTFHDSLHTTTYGCDSIYTLMLTVNQSAHSVENASACSNETVYSWHGRDITATGTYFDTLFTVSGCDSVCELRFTLLEPTAANFVDTICVNAPYQDYGFELTPTISGDTILERIIDNVAGCDSTITVNLYVKPEATFSFDTIVCGAFSWNNQWYMESGSYQQSFTAANGCDSIVTMNLTIDTEKRDTIEVVACESYEWDGTTYTQSGVFPKVYPQAVGCDSIAVMILTINHVTEVTLYDTTCQAHRYQEYGFDTLTMEAGTFTLQRIDENVAGCDSIINLVLTVHRGYLDIDSASTCDNNDFVWHGINCDTTGIYYKNYETIHGCDSVFILFLTVYPSYDIEVTDTAIAGTPYHNHGLNFTPQNPGTLDITVPRTTVDGCDSIVHVTLIVVNGSGVDMHYLDKHITIFPNPTENVFNVSSSIDIIRELTIYDNNGRAVLHQNINDYIGQVNVENLTPGIYFVRLMTPDNIVTKKLIVR